MSVNVVIGAGGKTGFQCVKKLAAGGRPVRAVVRSPDKYKEKLGAVPSVSVVAGDVTQKPSIQEALEGAKNVIFAASRSVDPEQRSAAVDQQGLANVADVCLQLGVERLVVVSSGLVDPKNKDNEIRQMLNKYDGVMDAKFAGEEYLRKSGQAYTIVRPGGLVDEEGGQAELMVAQGDNIQKPNSIPREDVAAVCVAALTSSATLNTTFELWRKPEGGAQQADVSVLFEGLQKDVVEAM